MNKYDNYTPNDNGMEPKRPKDEGTTGKIVKYIFILTIVFMISMSVINIAKSDNSEVNAPTYEFKDEESFMKRNGKFPEDKQAFPNIVVNSEKESMEVIFEGMESLTDYRKEGSEYILDINANDLGYININTLTTKVDVEAQQDTSGKVIIQTSSPDNFLVQSDGYSLVIKEVIPSGENNDKVKIKLPRVYIDELIIESASGSIDVENIDSDFINIVTQSSKIELESSTSDVVFLESTSGSVKVDEVFVRDKMIVKNVSGEVNLEKIEATSLHATTTTGRIKAEEIRTNYIETITSQGEQKIELERMEDLMVVCHSDSGIVEYRFNKNQKISNNGSGYYEGSFVFDSDSDNSFTANVPENTLKVSNK